MASPATGAEVVAGTEEFEKGLRHALMDVEERPQGGIKPFDSAGGAMPVVEKMLDGIEQFIGLGAKQAGELSECTGQSTGHVGALPGAMMTFDVTYQAPNQCGQAYGRC